MLANQPAVVERVNLFVALAPIVHMTHVDIPFLRDFAKNTKAISSALKTEHLYEFLGIYWQKYSKDFCGHWYFKFWCDQLDSFAYSDVTMMFNYPERQKFNNLNSIDGISLRQIAHYGQVIKDGFIADYDFGSEQANMQAYGTPSPKRYDLSTITDVPVAMFVGREDPVADPTDTAIAHSMIPSVVFYKEYAKTDHQSFQFGKYTNWFADALPLVNSYNNRGAP
eukprot:CAMPEP_0170494038 /NCGR_PEP_ID=MMETSP0208-20121228/14408_1 /TAXON_ID=197538 /ORGANISM="Strombidium inclinatum, Strain S3" /LENGTH=223 /DNA_ID=CAMNT_0010770027 /DNA_START=715 /DNA_END=1389 /DNA_ORIENTATION=+